MTSVRPSPAKRMRKTANMKSRSISRTNRNTPRTLPPHTESNNPLLPSYFISLQPVTDSITEFLLTKVIFTVYVFIRENVYTPFTPHL